VLRSERTDLTQPVAVVGPFVLAPGTGPCQYREKAPACGAARDPRLPFGGEVLRVTPMGLTPVSLRTTTVTARPERGAELEVSLPLGSRAISGP
jgi:hypothetical protein